MSNKAPQFIYEKPKKKEELDTSELQKRKSELSMMGNNIFLS